MKLKSFFRDEYKYDYRADYTVNFPEVEPLAKPKSEKVKIKPGIHPQKSCYSGGR
jgi:hypothetical protein